jgi:hypothetical protein
MASKTKIMTPEFRVSYPALMKARSAPGSDVEKFSVVMIFDKSTDISALRQLAKEAILEKWPTEKTRPKNLRTPFRDGDKEKDGVEGYQNAIFITASSKMRPGVVDQDVQPVIDESVVYPGCYARATVVAYAYDQAGNRGVAFVAAAAEEEEDLFGTGV